jgi:hypothetical protein
MAVKQGQSCRHKKHLRATDQLTTKSSTAHTKSISNAAPVQAKSLTIGSEPNANSKGSLFSHETGIAFSRGVTPTPKTEECFEVGKVGPPI